MPVAPRLNLLRQIQGEIESSLDQAQTLAAAGEWAAARRCLHQVLGALDFADCRGAQVLAGALEQLLGAAAEDMADPAAFDEAFPETCAVLATYLRQLLTGADDRPLALYPAYRQALLAAGAPKARITPVALFFPDLSQLPPPRAKAPAALDEAALEARFKAARLAFHRGWDKWRQGSADQQARALRDLRNAVAIIEQLQAEPAARAFWWICVAFFDALADSPGEPGDPLRQELAPLLERIDGQIAKLASGSPAIALSLLRDVLYEVAVADSHAESVQAVRAAYRLAELLPKAPVDAEAEQQRLDQRTALADEARQAQIHWEHFHAGSAVALPAFDTSCKRLADLAEPLGDAALRTLAEALRDAAQRLRKKPLDCSEALAEEIAVALLLLETWADEESAAPLDVAQRSAERLSALGRGKAVGPAVAIPNPHVSDLVTAEIAANLRDAEALLDSAFTQTEPGAALTSATLLLKQVEGALALLDQPAAAQVASGALVNLARLSRPGTDAPGEEQRQIAEGMAAIAHHLDHLDDTAQPAAISQDLPPPMPTVEAELAAAQANVSELATELQARPDGEVLVESLRESLVAMEADARLSADAELIGQIALSLAALDEDDVGAAIAPWLSEAEAESSDAAEEPPVEDWQAEWDEADEEEASADSALPEEETAPAAEAASPSFDELVAPPDEDDLAPLPDELASDIDNRLLPLFLDEARAALPAIFAPLQRWQAKADDPTAPGQLRRQLHTLKGSAQMAGVLGIAELIHDLEECVDAADLGALADGLDRMAALIDALGDEETPLPPPPVEGRGYETGGPLPVPVERVDQLLNDAGEVAAARGRLDGELGRLKSGLGDLADTVERIGNQLRELSHRATARQDNRGEELKRLTAESMDDLAAIQQSLARHLDQTQQISEGQSRLNRGLSQNLLALRLAPFALLAERLHRSVRVAAQEQGKQAGLVIDGANTEVDRAVLERIVVPLEHLLRNAVAHGIESVALRRQARKDDAGHIVLSVKRKGSEVTLEVADDGAGLDLDRIRQRGEASGLLVSGTNTSAKADEAQLTALIFEPGFSTAPLSATSGQGVGLDLVRHEIAALGGRIEVDSAAGQSCRFRLTLPQTLALGQVLLVESGGRRYGIPAQFIEQAGEISAEDMHAVRRVGGASWSGGFYPWHYLPRLLGDETTQPRSQRRYWRVLVKSGTRRIALEVDGAPVRQEVVMKPIGPQLARVPGMAGATVLGDGEVVLLIDPALLAERANKRRTAGRSVGSETNAVDEAAKSEAAKQDERRLVLIVDDSLTARRSLGRTLERAGYRVAQARDGMDALNLIGDERPDLIVTDIDMPRMDGFDFLRRLRADEALASIPVVMLTGLATESYREQARGLGVEQVFGKTGEEGALLKAIAELLAA